ncbi:membrane bound O-acyl transferase family-domain-containing protein [Aspergillus crustosus]
MHGQFTEAYTIRQFWGVSWHQCLRRGLSSHANFFADSILSLPRGTLLSRYMRIFGAFFLSGLLHQVLDCALGLPFAKAGAIAFFSVQAAGIVVEDAVEALSQTLPFFRNNAWVRRTVGYLWVAGFLVWSTPIWMYPAVRLQLDPTQLFPFHLTMPFLTSGAAVSA